VGFKCLTEVITHLDGKAFYVAVRAINAAISFEWFKDCAAALAIVEEQADICWYSFGFGVAILVSD
jgi:hypothetical protein